MTNAQQRTIDKIKESLPQFDFYGDTDQYEIKKFSIKETEYFVEVYIVTGMKNDDGTMASLTCRKHRQGFIGKRGGITILNDKSNSIRCSIFEFLNEHYHY